MATEIIMPALGMAQKTGIIIRWLISEGEKVDKGVPIMEIETDKATVEIESPASGILSHVTAEEGDEIPVGERIAWILADGEMIPSDEAKVLKLEVKKQEASSRGVEDASKKAELTQIKITPVAKRLVAEMGIDVSKITPNHQGKITKEDVLAYVSSREKDRPQADGRVVASPKARRLMKQKGFSPSKIEGTGPEGAIIEKDVFAYEAALAKTGMGVQPKPITTGETLKMSRTWKVMAEETTQSWMNTPHFYLMREVDVSQLVKWRESFAQRVEQKVTYTDLLIRIVAESLRRHPRANAIWFEGKLIQREEINVAIAIALDDGLVAPAVINADKLTVEEIAVLRQDLIQRAKQHQLKLDELQSGCITISNLGMYGIDVFSAIISSPQPAILAVGRILEKPVVVNGEIVIRPMMSLTLSCDHRVIDGVLGAEVLSTISELIEEPVRMLK